MGTDPKCNLLLTQARPRMIQHLSSFTSVRFLNQYEGIGLYTAVHLILQLTWALDESGYTFIFFSVVTPTSLTTYDACMVVHVLISTWFLIYRFS